MSNKLKYFQKGFNFSQDGPGNRLVYHLQGCNMTCPWCANPEGIPINGVLMTNDNINGKYCINGAVSENTLDRSKCKGCNAPCADIPASGIKRSYIEDSVESIVSDIQSCRMMFFDGGGVTFSGGEPTMQFEALSEILGLLKQDGINTCMECNATHRRLPELFDKTDFLITDCKHYDREKLLNICSADLNAITENIKAASKYRKQLLIRIPLIGGFNADEKDAERFAQMFSEICADFVRYEFLRYHEFGKPKYQKCGMEYTLDKTVCSVPPETVKQFTEIFNKYSLKTIHT